MTRSATVKKLLPDGKAEVEVHQKEACSSECADCRACELSRQINVIAENPLNALPGDTVTIESSTAIILKAAALFYLLPPAFMVAFYYLFPFGEAVRIGASAFGFLISLLFCRIVYSKVKDKNKIIYTIKEVLR